MSDVSLDCYDLKGKLIENLTQWDQNQYIVIKDLPALSTAPLVHFQNMESTEALVVKTTLEDNEVTVQVPNKLLQESLRIDAYVYYYEELTSARSIAIVRIPVRKRAKPSDYLYVENIDITSVAQIEQKVNDKLAEADVVISNAEEATGKANEATETALVAIEQATQAAEHAEQAAQSAEQATSLLEETIKKSEEATDKATDASKKANESASLADEAAIQANEAADKANAAASLKDISEKTVTFTKTEQREPLQSDETVAVLLGQISKWLDDLKMVAFTGKYGDLIDAPAIANNLTTVNPGQALDASQGKILYDLSESIHEQLAEDVTQEDILAIFNS